MPRTLRQIVEDDRTNWQKAEECLMALDETQHDVARNYRAASITFALFAVIEQMQDDEASNPASRPSDD